MKLKRVLKSLLVFLIVTIGVYALYFNKKLVSEFDKIEQPIDEIIDNQETIIDDENDSLEDNNEVIDKVEINKPVENKPSNEEDKEPVEEQPLTQA